MTLLYLEDYEDDDLSGLLSRFFDDINTERVEKSLRLKQVEDDTCCIVVNFAKPKNMEVLTKYKKQYSNIPMMVVIHKHVDVLECIRMGIDGYILYPYDEDQINLIMSRYRYLKERTDAYDEKELTNRDYLTSLYNADSLYQKIKNSKNDALILIDIDNFDIINTLYGMDMGDKVLAKVAGYLYKMAPKNSSLHRLNADEFVFLLNNPPTNQTDIISKQIKSFFELTHFQIEGINFNLRVSIGMAYGTSKSLFHHAKIALKEAKDNGKNSIVPFRTNSPFLKKQRKTLYWINEVRSALEENRVLAYYQPIFDNASGKVLKYEALCRLEDTNHNIIQPQEFIHAARIGGLITNVTRAMIDNAFKMFSGTDNEFSINVTREDFNEGYILAFLKRKCHLYDIAPSQIFIEVVEDISFELMDGYLEQLQSLSNHGFKLAIDDFGTESSNYSRLLNIKADYLKIDGRFIENIDQNVNTQIIVESIVTFAKRIGARTIAEYVNSPSVLKKIQEIGVDFAQGYYIGKAQPYLIASKEIA